MLMLPSYKWSPQLTQARKRSPPDLQMQTQAYVKISFKKGLLKKRLKYISIALFFQTTIDSSHQIKKYKNRIFLLEFIWIWECSHLQTHTIK